MRPSPAADGTAQRPVDIVHDAKRVVGPRKKPDGATPVALERGDPGAGASRGSRAILGSKRADKLTCPRAPRQREINRRTRAVHKHARGDLTIYMGGQSGIVDARDSWMGGKVFGDRPRVIHMALHADLDGIKPLSDAVER